MKATVTLVMVLLIALMLSASSAFAGPGTAGTTGGPGYHPEAVGMQNGHIVERQAQWATATMDGCCACCASTAGFGCCTGVAMCSGAPALTMAIAGIRLLNELPAAPVLCGIDSPADQRPPRA